LNFKNYSLIVIIYLIAFGSTAISADQIPTALKTYLNSFQKGRSQEKEDQWFSPDKGYHVMGSLISTTLLGQISIREFGTSVENSKVLGACTTLALGISKEIYDSGKSKNYFSWKDLTANGLGIIIGILLLGIK
jgi:uncharacterized protein YfiM (DUF2279 family)